jgi:hypothetical protein
LKTFLWVMRDSLQPVGRRASAGANWAQVSATVQSVSFDPGDGSPPVVCPGGGTPYDPALPYEAQAGDCWHVYTRPSSGGPFRLRVTVAWSATWAGSGGAGGVLPAVAVGATVPVQVQEMQVVDFTDRDRPDLPPDLR